MFSCVWRMQNETYVCIMGDSVFYIYSATLSHYKEEEFIISHVTV